jgi:hypothetical protein
MSFPWEPKPAPSFPWEPKPAPPELDKDDIPEFLRRVRMPDGSVRIGVETSLSSNPQASTPTSLPPWASTN